MNMFVCSPRKLRPLEHSNAYSAFEADYVAEDETNKTLLDVKILERHPFTSQTFIPMGTSRADPSTQYLVIVAPTLPAAGTRTGDRQTPYPVPERKRRRSIRDVFSKARPAPYTNENAPQPSAVDSKHWLHEMPKGTGLPDLSNIRAFLATGGQAVTYAAGTWHAPMVVLGKESIDYAVVQYANGVGVEDCQELELRPPSGSAEGITVEVEMSGDAIITPPAAIKAKL